MLYASIMARSEASNSSKTWNVPLRKVYGVQGVRLRPLPPGSKQSPEGRGCKGRILGTEPDLHRVDLHRSVQLDSVLLTASKMESTGEYIMA